MHRRRDQLLPDRPLEHPLDDVHQLVDGPPAEAVGDQPVSDQEQARGPNSLAVVVPNNPFTGREAQRTRDKRFDVLRRSA